MNPRFFGESRDAAKRMTMQWLAPNQQWAVHPMWYNQRPETPEYAPFLARYSAALNAAIVVGESPNRNVFLVAAQACDMHLLLDPDTGLGDNVSNEHITYDEFIQILNSPHRQDRLTLIYDQGYARGQNEAAFRQRVNAKLQRLRHRHVHAVAYIAEPTLKVCFIWASTDAAVVTAATRIMQQESHFPALRFTDDGCGHVGN